MKELKAVRAVAAEDSAEPAFTNPLLLDKVLAHLQAPAEVRRHCVEELQKGGGLSVDALHTMLAGPAAGSGRTTEPPVVSASDVQELIASIRVGDTQGVAGLSALRLKKHGVYTLDEFKDLLRPLTQARKVRAVSQAARRAAHAPLTAPTTGETESAATASVTAAPEGYVERLSESRLPSFSGAIPTRPPRIQRSGSPAETQSAASPLFAGTSGASRPGEPEDAGKGRKEPFGASAGPSSVDGPLVSGNSRFSSLKGSVESMQSNRWEAQTTASPTDGTPETTTTVERLPAASPSLRSQTSEDGAETPVPEPTHGFRHLHSAVAHPKTAADVNVPWRAAVPVIEDAPAPVDEIGGDPPEFEVRSLTGADAAKGAGHAPPTSHSDRRQEGGHDSEGFPGSQADEYTVGSSRGRGENLPGSISSTGGAEARFNTATRTTRVNLHHPAWPSEIAERLVEGTRTGKSSLVVEFEPRDFGHMTLRIEADQRQVTAWISTRSEEARVLLLQHSSSLQKHLAEHGLSLAQLTVDIGDAGGGSRGNPTHRSERRASRIGIGTAMGRKGPEVVPGVHRRPLGAGGNQTISLVI